MVTWKTFLKNGTLVPWLTKAKVTFDQFNKPKQGGLKDCSFMAALSSVTWAAPDKIKNASRGVPIPSIPFRTDAGQLVSVGLSATDQVKIENILPLDGSSLPSWAISQETFEYWVPFYEKAYGSFLIYIQDALKPGGTVNAPDWTQAPEAGALRCMYHLTGKSFAGHIYDTGDIGLIWNNLQNLTQLGGADPSRMVKYPAVAWTYPPGAGPGFSDAVITEKHAYSLLGIHESGAKKYVILRNPHGQDVPYLAGSPYELADGTIKFSSPEIFSWELFPATDGNGNPQMKNGVFALRLEDFSTYFAGYGWVT